MKTEELFKVIDGIDDNIILDIPQLKAEKPSKITLKKHAPVWNYVSIAACFVCALAVGIFAVTKIHGNITTSTPEKNTPYYDDVFQGANLNPATGAPMTYDEIAEMLKSDPEHPEWDMDSFFLVETVKVLTLEECRALAGWEDIYSDRVMYKVKVIKDLISDETVDRYETFYTAMGNAMWQTPGDPVYAPGERFTIALTKKFEGCDFLRAPGAFALRYDAVETEDGITLYSRRSELDKLAIPGSESIDEKVITSTTKNPAVYTQKIKLDDFVSFLRSDWEQRGLSSHFENNSNSGNENPSNSGTSQPGDPNTYYDTEIADYSRVKEVIKFIDVPAPSDDENGIHGYEIEYAMPSKTPIGVRYGYIYGEVVVRDNSIVTLAPSPEHYKRIEYGGRVFWRDLSDDLTAIVVYISEDNISYTAYFMDETQAIEKIISLF